MYLGTHHMMVLVPTKSSCCTYIIKVHRLYDFIPNDTSNMLYAAMEIIQQVPCSCHFKDGYASKSEDDDDNSKSFQNVLLKNLNALYHFIRPYACAGVVIAATSNSLLPVEKLSDLTPTFFIGLLKALVPALLMHIYVAAINQLSDVEIDKVNKPYLPLASGEFSMGTGIAITLTSVLMSLAIAIMLRSPPLVLGVIVWFLFGTAYSVQGNSFLAAISIMFLNGLLQQFPYFIHIQKYVLGRPVEITRSLMFATVFICCFCIASAFLKDLHDVDGDKEFGIETLSVKLGKERVFWLCVYMLSIAYGAAVVVGASSSILLSKLLTIISHCILASSLWLRARTVDLSSNTSTFSFYMFIWKLYYVEYLLIPFVRC
ncbi:homogentisate phytyltransferase 1 [Citrus sinensis]|uniref:Homogentisate phytyltransferase 1 n=1 Tax=Citrus sinensis TaxID=2711 RepID=A0ACB8NLV8_CITSI|nr:homogentisate phytyltransferase 1 [Citrus sinensis]